jgi:hypothetical protein
MLLKLHRIEIDCIELVLNLINKINDQAHSSSEPNMNHMQEHLRILCDAEDAGYQLIDDLQLQISMLIISFIDSM